MATNVQVMHSISQNATLIDMFAEQAVNLAIKHNFDGLDFDWEYPCLDKDRFQFTYLLERARFYIQNSPNNNLLMSAAIGAGKDTIDKCYDVPGLVTYLDYINVMCYDYNTIYNTYTAYASPLFARPEETGSDLFLNSNFTINYLINEYKVPRRKIVLGLNAGGHTFQLKSPDSHGFHVQVFGIGYGGGWSRYPDLCKFIRTGDAVGAYDEVAQVLYAHYLDQWTNTGDVRSARVKSKWAKRMGLAGVFTWCLNWDDLENACGHNVKFPIHRAIRNELFRQN